MKSRFLFPHNYKRIGWLLTIPSLALGIAREYFQFSFRFLNSDFLVPIDNMGTDYNLTNEFACIGLIAGLILLAFSKEKIEDEQIARTRLESLQWSVYFNYIVLIICVMLVNGFAFLQVMLYNMFTLLVFFLLRFHYILFTQNKLKGDSI